MCTVCGMAVWNKSGLVRRVRRYFYKQCVVCGMKVWNKSELVQHVTTEKRKWGDHLAEAAAGHLSAGILGNKKHSLAPILLKKQNKHNKNNTTNKNHQWWKQQRGIFWGIRRLPKHSCASIFFF